MTPSPASPDAKGLSKERIELDADALKAARDAAWATYVEDQQTPGLGLVPAADAAVAAYLSALSAQERAEPVQKK